MRRTHHKNGTPSEVMRPRPLAIYGLKAINLNKHLPGQLVTAKRQNPIYKFVDHFYTLELAEREFFCKLWTTAFINFYSFKGNLYNCG